MSTSEGQSEAIGSLAGIFVQGLRSDGLSRLLSTVRKYLGMDVAFISKFRAEDRVLQRVDAEAGSAIRAGQVIPLEQGYCWKVTQGVLPQLIPDTSKVPAALAIPETQSIPIGAHLSVPILLPSGDVYGTLCCFRYKADDSLGDRDMQMMRAFAEVLASHIDDETQAATARAHKLDRVQRALAPNSPRIVYQPIYDLRTGVLAGVECLSRFDLRDPLSPSEWFDLADEVGLRQDLERAALERGLATAGAFPAWTYIGVNSSPQTILSGVLAEALKDHDLSRLVLEITEHAIVADYGPLCSALQPLRAQGLRIAIDDAGAGYASMRHIISLLPDFIKLDMSLVRSLDRDPARRALARALIAFSKEIGSHITAEGIETQEELDTLRDLGVDAGQGFFLREPVSLEIASSAELHHFELCGRRANRGLPN